MESEEGEPLRILGIVAIVLMLISCGFGMYPEEWGDVVSEWLFCLGMFFLGGWVFSAE